MNCIGTCKDVHQLMGYEGIMARLYFEGLSRLMFIQRLRSVRKFRSTLPYMRNVWRSWNQIYKKNI